MTAGFEKVKNRYKRRALVCSVAGGVLCGLAVTGILLIALKLSAVVLGWYFYLIIGVCAAVLGCGALWLILRPRDLKLARKLDKTYALDEQTRTRVEFAKEDGTVIALQRQTTDETLENLPKKRPSVLNIILQTVALLVALALFISGIVVPQKRVAVVEDPPYTLDETKYEQLQLLIDNVQGDSVMESGVRTSYVEELNVLLENLNSDDLSDAKVTGYVQDSMYNISDITIAANTYDDVARVLSGCGISGVEYIAEAIRSSARASGSDGANTDLSSYDNLGTAAQSKISPLVVTYMSEMGDTLQAAVKGLTDDTVLDTLDPYISAIEAVLTDESLADYYAALTGSGITFGSQRTSKATSGDDLYDELYDLYYVIKTAYTAFYNYVYDISGGTKFTSASNVQYYIINNGTEITGNNVYSFVIDGGTALQAQAYTYLADAYIRYTLGVIFGVTVVGSTVDDGDSDSGASGDSDDSSGGGGGTGETLYPGDDIIYNPDNGDYQYYYEMLNSGYLTQLYDLLDSDDVSDEVKSYIRAYINELL